VMATELYNDALGTVYRLGPETYYEIFLPTEPATVLDDGTIARHGKPLSSRYVLTTCRTPIEGSVVAVAPRGSLELVAVEGSLRLSARAPCTRPTP
jgi:hypothetical protein